MLRQLLPIANSFAIFLGGLGLVSFAFADAPPGSATASKVVNPVSELTLTQVHLRQDAESRLGIRVQTPTRGTMPTRRLYPGHAMASMGNDVTLHSPITGVLHLPAFVGNLRVPWSCDRSAPLLTVMPTAPDGGMITLASAEGEAKAAEVELEASRIRQKRAEVLRQNNASAQKTLDDATAELQKAEARAASTKLIVERVKASLGGIENGSFAGISMTSPIKGLVTELYVTDCQIVAAGTSLLRITNSEQLWIRVSVPAGELSMIDEKAAASIGDLGSKDAAKQITAERIFGPQTTNAVSGAVDLYYEFSNKREYRPGQRLSASLLTKQQSAGAIIPSSCIMTDMHGGDWVYLRIAEQTYARRRVEVVNQLESNVLVSNLSTDLPIVVTGAAELFGIEFGAGK